MDTTDNEIPAPGQPVPNATHARLCTSCGAPIYWLANDNTGKPAPIETRMSARGNVAINLTLRTYHIVRKDERAQFKGWLHLNHFVECPQASIWHKAGRSPS